MQQKTQTIRTSFNKGLISETTELNFPEDASVDELNCDLFRAGNRTKRLGVNKEVSGGFSNAAAEIADAQSVHEWKSVGQKADVDFIVVQSGSKLRFYNKGVKPVSAGRVPISDSNSAPYVLNLSAFNLVNEVSGYASGTGAASSKIQVASYKGRLVVVSPQIEAFYIERDFTDNSFSTHLIDFKVRDFDFYSDKSTLTQDYTQADFPTPPVFFSFFTYGTEEVLRQYDSRNCGWTGEYGDAALTAYIADDGKYPSLTLPWYAGKNSSGDFNVAEWRKVFSGNSLVANGHYIRDLFNRRVLEDAPPLQTNPIKFDGTTVYGPRQRFKTVATYAGRCFFAGADDKVYFTRLSEDIADIGDLYQVNDPTSEDFPDLLDTDGGYISIPEMVNGTKLHVYGSSLFIFAANGVWRLSGVDDVFRASQYSVAKLTDYGLVYEGSFATGANNIPFWWSSIGIHTVVIDDNGYFREVNVSQPTIQTYWSNIGTELKIKIVSAYDALRNRVFWFYPNSGETITPKLNNILVFDVELQAFFPWKVSDSATESSFIVGATFDLGGGLKPTTYTVVDSEDNPVIDSLGNSVISTQLGDSDATAELILVCLTFDGRLFFGNFRDTSFLDWGNADYDAYLVSAYNFVSDLARVKNTPYITTLLKRTEEGWEESGGLYQVIRPSSLLVSTYWDFKTTPSTAQEVYRYKYPLVVDADDLETFDYPKSIIQTKLKLRGRGTNVKIRFEGTTGKDFNLLGWETLDAVDSAY